MSPLFWCFCFSYTTANYPAIHRVPVASKVSFTNNDVLAQAASGLVGNGKNQDGQAATTKQWSSFSRYSPNKKSLNSYGTAGNQTRSIQINSKMKDQGRKRLDVAKTAPLLLLSNTDSVVYHSRTELPEKADQQMSSTAERQKSSVIKKLRENCSNAKLECQEQDKNYVCKDLECRQSKLRNNMAVRNFGSAKIVDGKQEIGVEIPEIGSSKVLKRPMLSRRRKSKRIIRQDSKRMTGDLIGVKSLPSEVSM